MKKLIFNHGSKLKKGITVICLVYIVTRMKKKIVFRERCVHLCVCVCEREKERKDGKN